MQQEWSGIAEITKSSLPKEKIDGISFASLLQNSKEESKREHFLYYYGDNSLEAVRNDRFKFIFPHTHTTYQQPGNDGFPGKTSVDTIGLSLFDLRRDPGERYDVKADYPQMVEQLSAIAEEARKDLGDDLTNSKGYGQRQAGILPNND